MEAANGLDNSFWALISFGAWNPLIYVGFGLVNTLHCRDVVTTMNLKGTGHTYGEHFSIESIWDFL